MILQGFANSFEHILKSAGGGIPGIQEKNKVLSAM